jgi:mannose-6-phosphate isomerase-like protein (cupin superfamily)
MLATTLAHATDGAPTPAPWGEWRRHLRGDTHGTKGFVVSRFTLKPGQAPHPPHQHADEELMILAEGSGTWHLEGKDSAARAGDVAYAAPFGMHGLRNTGTAPLSYYVIKWTGKGVSPPVAPAR